MTSYDDDLIETRSPLPRRSVAEIEAWCVVLVPLLRSGGIRVLDVGIGTGAFALLLAHLDYRVTGVGGSARMVEHARMKTSQTELEIEFQSGLAERLPVPDSTVDAVTERTMVAEFVPDLPTDWTPSSGNAALCYPVANASASRSIQERLTVPVTRRNRKQGRLKLHSRCKGAAMLILAMKPGHDGAVAAIRDGQLLFSIEAEKDSFTRYADILPGTVLAGAELAGEMPDVVALGGWYYQVNGYGVDYGGSTLKSERNGTFFGHPVRYYSSSHERSHIYGALGMSPNRDRGAHTAIVWEGDIGKIYQLDDYHRIITEIEVLREPGARYGLVYAIADPSVPDTMRGPYLDHAGKLMALAAYGDPHADKYPQVAVIVDQLLGWPTLQAGAKGALTGSELHNAGVESDICKDVAAVITRRIFEQFSRATVEQIPPGTHLLISGGCGLNCAWNAAWRRTGHFESVFVPPCPNDSGSAIGTAIDAQLHYTGNPFIDWSVYCGLEFNFDTTPPADQWKNDIRRDHELSRLLVGGAVVAWVQGRWEMGPRALGNRSLLAEPFKAATRARLNQIKQREGYRPIAPCIRVEDIASAFGEDDFEDPYMLYFRAVRDRSLAAVTHVDGSARAQTVSVQSNPRLHSLLNAFATHTGMGVLCNTSLNGKGLGFINSMSDLLRYADARGLDHLVVGDQWWRRR